MGFPLSVHSSGRYLIDSSGNPFWLQSRTVWGAMMMSSAEQATLIADCVTHGFNSVAFGAIWRDDRATRAPLANDSTLKPFDNNLSGGAWVTSTVTPDYTTPNTAYWSFFTAFIDALAAAGIIAFVWPSYVGTSSGGGSTPDDGWANEMNQNGPTNLQTYGAFFANLVKTKTNILYGLGGDAGTSGRPFGSEKAAEIGMINGILSVTGQASGPQFGAEWGNGSIGADQTDFLVGSSGATLGSTLTTQTFYEFFGGVIPIANNAFSSTPIKPPFVQETAFDQEDQIDGTGGNAAATQPIRRFYWWSVTAGGINGVNFGNGYIWEANKTGTPPASDNWQNHVSTQGTLDIKRMGVLMNSVQWWKLVPSGVSGMRTLIVANAGTGTGTNTTTTVTAAQASDGSFMLCYRPPDHTTSFSVDLRSMRNNIRARWWDPTTGTYSTNGSAAGTFTLLNTTSAQVFTVPGTNSAGDADWLLVLDTVAQKSATIYWIG